MGVLINGRAPEDIKTALRLCNTVGHHCWRCPYGHTCLDHPPEIDALALIERLEAKWISVKDRLPPREVNVLTVNGHGRIRMMAFWQNYKNCWLWNDNAVFKHYNDITHWMPLPKPPKEEPNA